MHVYFAGATRVEEGFPELQHEVRKRLVSYHYQTPALDKYYYEDERDKYHSIILDSGAFSAWSRGAVIDLEKYIEYALKWKDKVSYIVNLDVIPGTVETKEVSVAEKERAAEQGFKNYYAMLAAGIPKEKLIHVYHQGEDVKWLKKMVHEDKMPYIGLSPANNMTVKEKQDFLVSCMPYVTDPVTGQAIVKFHGFAVTSHRLMQLFPWYSVDSSTWAVAGGRGEVSIPDVVKGTDIDTDPFDFTVSPLKVSMSQTGGKKDHYRNLLIDDPESDIIRKIHRYLRETDIPLGEQCYLRTAPNYEINKEKGFRKCSNSFVKNMKFELDHDKEHGFLGSAIMSEIDINLQDTARLYEGENPKWVEHVICRGILNYWKERQRLNAVFINKFVDILDKQEPRAFNLKAVDEGMNINAVDEDMLDKKKVKEKK